MHQQIKGPIFLVGCPRSGTTLLQQMLDAHPAIAIAPETHFIRRFWLQRETYGDLTQDHNYQKLINDIIAIPEFSEMELNSHEFSEAVWQIKRDYSSIFHLLLKQFAGLRQVQIVGEKTPNHLLYMQTLQAFFPDARFIHIVRDPRAVVNSWRTVPWSTGSIQGDAKVWRRYMRTAQQTPPAGQTLFTLHYEHLVSKPEECLRNICQFLNLEFEPAMLNYYQQETALVNVSREPWKKNAVKPVSESSLNRWQTDLSAQTIAEIEAIVYPDMQQLGYQRYSSPWQFWAASVQVQTHEYVNHAKKLIAKVAS